MNVLSLFHNRYHLYYLFLTDDQYIKSVFTIDAYFDVYLEPVYWMSLGMTSFVTLLVTIERYVAIRFPLKMRTSCGGKMRAFLLALALVIPVAMTLPNFFYYTVETHHPPFSEYPIKVAESTEFGKNDPYRCVYFKYIIPFLWYIIPWIVLAVLNILLVHQVMKSAKISHGASASIGGATNRRHSRNLTIVMIAIVASFLLFNLPKCVTVFLRMLHDDDACEPGSSGNEQRPETKLDRAEWIVSVLNTANSSFNFVFYCVIGERFRRQFQQMCCCCCCQTKRVAPWSTSNNTAQLNGSAI